MKKLWNCKGIWKLFVSTYIFNNLLLQKWYYKNTAFSVENVKWHALLMYPRIPFRVSADFFNFGTLWLWASQVAVVVKNLPVNAGDVGDKVSIPGSGRSPGGGNDNPLQYSCLESPMDRGSWWATVHRVAKSRTRLKWLSRRAYGLSRWDPPTNWLYSESLGWSLTNDCWVREFESS